MADSLFFDGINDVLKFSAGDFSGAGALSLAVIVKKTAGDGAIEVFMQCPTAGDQHLAIDSSNRMYYGITAGQIYPSGFPTMLAGDGWMLFGYSRPSGTVTGRFHIYRWDTTAWSHLDGGSSQANAAAIASTQLGAYNSGGDTFFFEGNMLVAGQWDSQLTDGVFETLSRGYESWIAAGPNELWRFDSMLPITSTVGRSVETTRVGTALDPGDVPANWDDSYRNLADNAPIGRMGRGAGW